MTKTIGENVKRIRGERGIKEVNHASGVLIHFYGDKIRRGKDGK